MEDLPARARRCHGNGRLPELTLCYALAYAILAFLLLGNFAFAGSGLSRDGRSLTGYTGFPVESSEPDDLLVVTLLDGRVVAVRQDSGAEVWSFDSGTPLVTVKQGQAMAPGLRIFPGVDGGLYAYGSALASSTSGEGGGAKLERLPITLPELVDSSPSLTDDGSVILGKRLTRVYVLDRDTGALLQQVSEGAAGAAAAEAAAAAAAAGAGTHADFGIEDLPVLQYSADRIVVVGREDYVVRSVQVHSGAETWNATYSRMVNLRPPGVAAARGARPRESRLPDGLGSIPRFTVGADHTLQAHDMSSGIRRWSIPFDTPPVGVFAARHGETNFLDPTATMPGGPDHKGAAQPVPPSAASGLQVDYPPAPAVPGGAAAGAAAGRGGGAGGPSRVLVGQLRGSLYALPADHVVLDESAEPQPWSQVAIAGGTTMRPGLPAAGIPQLPAAAGSAASGSVPDDKALAVIGGGGTDVLTYMTNVDSGEGVVSGLVCPPEFRLLATVEPPDESREPLPWLPDATRAAAARAAAAERQGLPTGGAGGGGGGGGEWSAGRSALPLLLAVVAAGVAGGAAVLVVLHVRGVALNATGAKDGAAAAAPAATAASTAQQPASSAAATSDVATAAKPTSGRQLDVDAIAGGGGGGGGISRSGAAGNQRRKKGKSSGGGHGGSSNGGANGGAVNGSTAVRDGGGGGVLLPPIQEDRALSASDEASLPPAEPATAPHLPSGEARVRVNADGSMAIGRLVVGPGILGYGSAGTIVYEGVLDGRPVAVKRLLRQFASLARKEIEVLILSDEHPNVVRCFALEEDREFVYLALERCRTTLSGFLGTSAGREQFVDAASGQPTPRCTSAMLDVVRGLAALHARGIVHRDLKPHNVLLTESSQRAKLSDMGLSKQLVPEASSFHDSTTGGGGAGGSSGWQAPEQLIARGGGDARQTRAMDVFSLGCILHYCMTGGGHPFGDTHYERDSNILHGAPRLGPLAARAGAEAAHLVAACLAKEPARRPPVAAVLCHPLWWSEERRLAFLVDISDRIENEDREPDTWLLEALEAHAAVALAGPAAPLGDGIGASAPASSASAAAVTAQPHTGTNRASASAAAGPGATTPSPPAVPSSSAPNWGAVLPGELIGNLGRYRRYDYTSLRDLLRVVRNKRNHFREMPPALQAMLGPLPGGFLRFFTARFPRLLLAVYVFARQHLAGEQALQQYWRGGAEREAQLGQEAAGEASGQAFVQTFMSMYGAAIKPIKPQAPPPQQQQPGALQPVHPSDAATGSMSNGDDAQGPGRQAAVAAVSAVPLPPSSGWPLGTPHAQAHTMAAAFGTVDGPAALAGPPLSFPASPARPTAPLSAAPFASPIATPLAAPPPPALTAATPPPALVIVGYEPAGDDGEVSVREFPRRPGKQVCEFYSKTGHCKFGDGCVFDHPEAFAVRLTALGLPLRPEEPVCTFYLKNAECRFGPACKFHHPMLRPVYAGSAGVAVGVGASAVVAAPVGGEGSA